MRRYIQKQLIQLIETLDEGIRYIVERHSNTRVDIFNDCLEGIDAIINILNEQHFNEQREEEYNFILHEIFNSMEIVGARIINEDTLMEEGEKVCLALNRLYIEIQKEEVKLEVVFLPYKVSMWDSLESIWRAACADERCECYVVPIPYYDKNSDGSFGELHYEGAEFPEDIPITSYEEYDFENRYPDIIYIHNPYDEYNYVTSIHPYFYSHKIKKFTDMLVYVPYCISGMYTNIDKGLKQYVTSAMIHSDVIITQNQQQSDFLEKCGCSKEKLVALGTPKLDAVYHMYEKPPKIPKEWKDKINNKKVILINFTLGTILQNEIWIDRYIYYIDLILKDDKFTIIYRPHPLMEATLKSMRPHLYSRYMKLINKISDKNNVIIDKNEMSEPAFWCSDAIISDYSSLPLKYIATGKPVYLFILNPKVYIPEEKRYMDKVVVFDYFESYFWTFDKEICIKEQFDVYEKTRYDAENNVFKVRPIEMTEFIKMIKNNSDINKENRIEAMKRSVINADGTSGYNINKYVVDSIYQGTEKR